jgi:ferritin
MVNQYKPGDIVTYTLAKQSDFIGVVREVDPKINKVVVAWAGGAVSQHDPEEIHLEPHQSEIVRSRMASRRNKVALDLVTKTTQFVSPELESLLNGQIGLEFYSAYLYFLAAVWFQQRGLVGFQAWMERQGHDEIGHGMKVYKFLADSGSNVVLPAIPAPVVSWVEAEEVTFAVLEHEKFITQKWMAIADLAKTENGMPVDTLAQWFMEEQMEEEDGAFDLHQKVIMGDTGTGLLLIDNDLKDRDPSEANKVASICAACEDVEAQYKRAAVRALAATNPDSLQSVGDPNKHGIETPISGGFGIMQQIVKTQRDEMLQESQSGNPKVAGMHSRRAMYWCNPARTYRMTQREVLDDTVICPKCKQALELEPYTKSEKMYRCPECSFKVPRGNVVFVGSELQSRRK